MFRIKHFSKFLTSASYPVHGVNGYTRILILDTSSNYGIRTCLNIPRNFYSNKCKDGSSNKVCDDKKHKEKTGVQTHPCASKPQDSCSDSVKLKECKPVDINPCKPPPDGYRPKLPSIQDCPSPNLFSKIPTPDCPWDDRYAKNRERNRRILMLGLLLTAVTIGTIFYLGLMDYKPETVIVEEEKKKRKKRQVIKNPLTSADIPKDVPYLLIGGGTASFSAFRAIKSADPTAKVLVITDESYHPYMRPPLSKEIWFNEDKEAVKNLIFKQWNGSERSLYYEPDDFYTDCSELMQRPNGGVAVARGWSITHLDVIERLAYLEDGVPIHYQKCLIATGASPKMSTVFKVASADARLSERIKLFRNIDDFEEVLEAYEEAKSIAIIGGGFLGSELACAMGRKDKNKVKQILQIYREDGNMGKILPEYLSNWTTEKVKSEGVEVLPKTDVVGVKATSRGALEMTLNTGHTVTVDSVIVTVGVEPNTQLAEKSDLEVDPELGGYLVNTELQARTDLYIAGDCACFYDPRLGRRRIEHHDHAVVSGRLAGENMTGARKPYYHQSMFWSDLGPDIGYEAIGIVDSSLPTVGIFAKATDQDSPKAVVSATGEGIRSTTEEVPKTCDKYFTDDQKKIAEESRKGVPTGEDYGKGVIFYLRNDIVVGIVLWNVFNRMSVARQVLKDQRKYDDLNEVAKLFNIHEE